MELRQGDIVAVLGTVESTNGSRLKLRLIDGTIIDNEVSIERGNAHLVQRAIYVEDAIIHKGRRFTMVSALEANIAIVVDEGADRNDIANYKMVYLADVIHAETSDLLKFVKADTHALPAPAGNPGAGTVGVPAEQGITQNPSAAAYRVDQEEKAEAQEPAPVLETTAEEPEGHSPFPADQESLIAPAAPEAVLVDEAPTEAAATAQANAQPAAPAEVVGSDDAGTEGSCDTIDGFSMAPGIRVHTPVTNTAPDVPQETGAVMKRMDRVTRLYVKPPEQAPDHF